MLVGLLLYLLGGSADYSALLIPTEEIRASIEENVSREEALGELTALLEEEEKSQVELSKEVSSICSDMLETNRNYDARSGDFAALDLMLSETMSSAQERGLSLRAEMKKRMTRQEWESVWVK